MSRSTKLRLLSVLALVAVLAAGAGLYLFQPWRLVTNREVQEALPEISVPASTPASTPASAAPAVRLLGGGAFVSHEHETSGRAELVRLADGRHQLLLRDLDTSDGPDLRVWLTDQPVLPGRPGWDVFDDGRWVELDRLRGNRGNQAYDVPASVDVTGLTSVSIWCKRFAVSFGAAPLSAA
ncbi:DM13 domain-containing protein [Spirilliplanes yamanashiensis]|uniref:DM13 domain-containing protein n=1 Tax=Spirilliplanes yamanashiensis TaxID=42233 RepID=A0A8J4DIX0_9ACTN|nr:DM13 domain-containing protein [Spirilliplanes yamanashiensis]MDP9816808.1 hypothetical protein [Spirilliplanes yamanashiensis]GIJ03537.1 hypothetical protein Sya03_28890 [Spirilliplanes yamanashiensis]